MFLRAKASEYLFIFCPIEKSNPAERQFANIHL